MTKWEPIRQIKTKNFKIELAITPDENTIDPELMDNYEEVISLINSGVYQHFLARVQVVHRMTGLVLGEACIGGNIYDDVQKFAREHLGYGTSYFTEMVTEAIQEARETLRQLQGIQGNFA